MKITEWIQACKEEDGKIYYEDNGVCWFWANKSVLRFNTKTKHFDVDFMMDCKPIDKLFTCDKDCAIAHIKSVEDQYLNQSDESQPATNNID